jgi:riboflavin kinase / FMN adenylyltransferase
MRVISWDSLLAGKDRVDSPVSITIGVFDGLHAGHRRLIDGVREDARGDGGLPLVITFRQNPDSFFPGRSFDGNLQTFRLKLAGLASLGIDTVLAIDFSRKLGKLTGKVFTAMLRSQLDIRGVVIGYDFHLGKERDTDATALRSIFSGSGVRMRILEPLLFEGQAVSSSRIRTAVRDARFRDAEAMLLSKYTLDILGLAKETERSGEWEIPRSRCTQVLPRSGSYEAEFFGDEGRRAGKLTITGEALRLEAEGAGTLDRVVFT